MEMGDVVDVLRDVLDELRKINDRLADIGSDTTSLAGDLGGCVEQRGTRAVLRTKVM